MSVMESPGSVLVTGSTGTVGAPLTALLAALGARTVAAARHPDAYPGPATCRELDFQRPDTFGPALAGIDRVFLMRPPAISDTKRYVRPFLAAAQTAGVRHVVFLSLMGVNPVMPHWHIEKDLRASTMTWTFLRPSFFAQNLDTAYGVDIRDHDRIRLPAGNAKTSFIDTADIAAVAALVLTDPAPHTGTAYTLTGGQALTYHQVASLLSAELGRPIDYQPGRLLAYRKELKRHQLPADYINVQLLINIIARLGLAATTTTTLATLLHRPPTTLADYLHLHRDTWTANA